MTDLLKLADRIEAGDAYDPTKNNGWLAGAFQMSPKFSLLSLTSFDSADYLRKEMLPEWELSIEECSKSKEYTVTLKRQFEDVTAWKKWQNVGNSDLVFGRAKHLVTAYASAILRAKHYEGLA